jgi:RNA-directed DNA polymerase
MNQLGIIRYEWDLINWPKVKKSVFKLQKRIYRASQRGDKKAVRKLQRLLLKSKSAKLLAIRRVTETNEGRKTAGVDGVKDLNKKGKIELARRLDISSKSKPLRRVWIPKPGKAEKRPLGIPTMEDRAKQALVKLILEPEWEAKFEPNSYGFRPGRGCHDAIEAIFISVCKKNVYVLDADIKGCFDNIDHKTLLEKIDAPNQVKKIIKGWLKSGILEREELKPTNSGTPQGGVISPLLANIALHGLEYDTKKALREDLLKYQKEQKKSYSKSGAQRRLSIVRYADDFVVMHESREIIEKAKAYIIEWLEVIGLKLSEEKTKIRHTLEPEGDDLKIGFDFLGFEIRQHKDKKRRKGYITLIKPSKTIQKRHKNAIKERIMENIGATQEELIKRLNPIITGWSNYCKHVVSSDIFSKMDHYMFCILWRWACKRHPNKGKKWIARKYFGRYNNNNWRFIAKGGSMLNLHSENKIRRHVKVQGLRSPYNGDKEYWKNRTKHKGMSTIEKKKYA